MKNEINESVYDINMDKLCQNSIELIKYARNITAKQVNNVQIMTYYSLGRWIVEVQQQGKHRAEYGKKIIINLSKKLTEEFGKGFSESTLEKARKFYLTYKDRISETLFTEFAIKKSETVFTIFEEEHPFVVTWSHYLQLMRIENEDERSFYEIEAAREKWGAAAGGNVLVKNVIPKHLEATTAKLLEVGCQVEEFDDSVRVISDGHLRHTQVTTLPYPGFPTDMQPQMAVLLGIAEGTSTVTESIFENRFKYVDELTRMGADIKVESNIAIISGVKRYTGARVNAPDLRAGAALVIAGLAAEGITVVDDIYYIQRGYEALEEKLTKIGAKIARVEDEKELQKFILKVS